MLFEDKFDERSHFIGHVFVTAIRTVCPKTDIDIFYVKKCHKNY